MYISLAPLVQRRDAIIPTAKATMITPAELSKIHEQLQYLWWTTAFMIALWFFVGGYYLFKWIVRKDSRSGEVNKPTSSVVIPLGRVPTTAPARGGAGLSGATTLRVSRDEENPFGDQHACQVEDDVHGLKVPVGVAK